MSDSDSDTYCDYLKTRKAALEKISSKRVQTKNYDSDSDDEFPAIKSPFQKKKKRQVKIVEEEEESFVEPSTHTQHLQSEMDQMEEQYRRQLYSKNEYMITSSSRPTDNFNVLTDSLKMCGAMDGEGADETDDEIQEASDADNSFLKTRVSATIEILDCEVSKKKTRHEVPLDNTLLEVRKHFATLWECGVSQVELRYNGETISELATPKSLGIRCFQIPYPAMEANKSERKQPECILVDDVQEEGSDLISLKIQIQNRKKPLFVNATAEMTILEIKERVVHMLCEEAENKVPELENMKVMFDDDYVDDEETCGALGLEDADCLDIYV